MGISARQLPHSPLTQATAAPRVVDTLGPWWVRPFNTGWGTCAASILALLLFIAGCSERTDEGVRRFQRATLSPCPLFSDDFLRWEGLPVCPFPAFVDMERPCAIEYYIEGDPMPRARRSLRFDPVGRLTAFSDTRNGTVIEARRIYYEREGDTWLSHHYAHHCDDPAPQFLYTLHETWDDAERPIAFSSGHLSWSLSYRYAPHLLRDVSEIIVKDGDQSRYALDVDPGGHIVGMQKGHTKSATKVDMRNGFVHDARWIDAKGSELAHALYTYEGERTQALSFEYPSTPTQTYRFIYTCEDEPICAPGAANDLVVTPVTATAFSRDPKLSRFVARNCSDQLAHGPHLCGKVLGGERGLSARCCHGDNDAISIEIRNQFAGPRVVVLTLKLIDGREFTSEFCRSDDYYSVCRIKRSLLMDLPEGMVTIEMTTESGQAIHVLVANADDLRRAAE